MFKGRSNLLPYCLIFGVTSGKTLPYKALLA